MLSEIRNSISFRRARDSGHMHDASLPEHVLRDIGFESRQVEAILGYTAAANTGGHLSHGSDAELSCRRPPAANSNERDRENATEIPDWWFSRMQTAATAEIKRLKR